MLQSHCPPLFHQHSLVVWMMNYIGRVRMHKYFCIVITNYIIIIMQVNLVIHFISWTVAITPWMFGVPQWDLMKSLIFPQEILSSDVQVRKILYNSGHWNNHYYSALGGSVTVSGSSATLSLSSSVSGTFLCSLDGADLIQCKFEQTI